MSVKIVPGLSRATRLYRNLGQYSFDDRGISLDVADLTPEWRDVGVITIGIFWMLDLSIATTTRSSHVFSARGVRVMRVWGRRFLPCIVRQQQLPTGFFRVSAF